MTDLILASASPRRQQLLGVFGMTFSVMSADIDETPLADERADDMTRRLAEEKARCIFRQVNPVDGNCRVLAGDTTVAVDGDILGKPENRDQAIDMLSRLSGRSHWVHTAVALADNRGCRSKLASTEVCFHHLSDELITTYCDTREPYDKAGAYGIQGPGGQFVATINGSYSAVVGLPLWETGQLLMADSN